MITILEAEQIGLHEIGKIVHLLGPDDSLAIMEQETMETESAWIFFYNSRIFLETGNEGYMVGGNAPLFISKIDGKIFTYRTGLSIEEMIAQHQLENLP